MSNEREWWESDMSSNIIRGTAILSIGLFLSKALGLLYVIPLYSIIGKESMGLYQYAYIPYNLFLSIAISGAPLAISKYVSKYNSLGDYETGRRLLKSGIGIMMFTGITSFLVLFSLSDYIAGLVIKENEQIYTIDQIATVIRWVSFALIVVPTLSIVRGFFQGYKMFEPSAVSQLVEQIVRIAFVLTGTSFVVYILKDTTEHAMNFAVFAAFIGALAGLAVLYKYWKANVDEFDRLRATSVYSGEKVSFFEMYKEVFASLVPFVLIGVINPLYQFVDMITFNKSMVSIGLGSQTDMYLTVLNLFTHKVVMIPVMVATAFSMALIPVITEYFTNKKADEMRSTLDKIFQIMFFLTIPMVLGIIVLSSEIYTLFFEYDEYGSKILTHYVPVAILFGLATVTAAILQSIDRHRWIIFTSLLGLLVKVVINIPMIQWFQTTGAIAATTIGYVITISLNIIIISKSIHYRSSLVIRRTTLIVILSLMMFGVVWMVTRFLHQFAIAETKGLALLYVLIGATVGVVVYGYLTLKVGLMQRLFGNQLDRLKQKLVRKG